MTVLDLNIALHIEKAGRETESMCVFFCYALGGMVAIRNFNLQSFSLQVNFDLTCVCISFGFVWLYCNAMGLFKIKNLVMKVLQAPWRKSDVVMNTTFFETYNFCLKSDI